MSDIYQPTDIILAKVKGYPAWPAMIVPNELIPETVLRNRSRNQSKTTNGKAADNDAKSNEEDESVNDQLDEGETFSDGDCDKYITYSNVLKFRKFDDLKSQYCVKFFCDDSYIWLKPLDMKPLTTQQCTEWLSSSKKKNKRLIPAYEMACKGSDGIDVWEFIEYGSAGKPDEEEYVQEYEEDDEEEDVLPKSSTEEYEDEEDTGTRKRSRGKIERSSVRQRQKRQRATQSARPTRATRSSKVKKTEISEEEPEISEDEDIVVPKAKRAKTKAKVVPTSKARNRTKAANKRVPTKPKYQYEDDVDWSIVGLGPQDLSIDEKVSPLVNKLSLKRNLDRHLESKLDLTERLLGVNKLLLELLIPQTKGTSTPLKDDYETLMDELAVALNVKGAHDEFITVFQSNNELLLNFRILFNLRRSELQDWELWDQFQDIFSSIYEYEFIPDLILWSEDKEIKQNVACREELATEISDITNDQETEAQA